MQGGDDGRRTAADTCLTPSASSSDAIGKPGLDKVHAQRVELPGELQFLAGTQRKAGRLLPSRSVVSKMVTRLVGMFTLYGSQPNRQIYNNEFVIKIIYSRPAWNWQNYAYFSRWHRNEAFRAASKLHRTQPAVSQAIRRLEDEVGERLFDRSSKDGTLTEAGRVLRDYAERLQRCRKKRNCPSGDCATSSAGGSSSDPMRAASTSCFR